MASISTQHSYIVLRDQKKSFGRGELVELKSDGRHHLHTHGGIIYSANPTRIADSDLAPLDVLFWMVLALLMSATLCTAPLGCWSGGWASRWETQYLHNCLIGVGVAPLEVTSTPLLSSGGLVGHHHPDIVLEWRLWLVHCCITTS